MINKKIFGLFLSVSALFITGCGEERVHLSSDSSQSEWGIEGVVPTIGKIYIDNVTVKDNGSVATADDMLKADMTYTLSADVVYHAYGELAGGKCVWTIVNDSLSKWQNPVDPKKEMETTSNLEHNSKTGSYDCKPVVLNFKKEPSQDKYSPDTVVKVSFQKGNGEFITQTDGNNQTYSASTALNTADRHNIINVATGPTTVIFWRKDGIFQSGFTAYRGMLGLEKEIGTAIYEANVKAPGSYANMSTSVTPDNVTSNFSGDVTKDKEIINKWLTSSDRTDTEILSKSAFVSSYGPPIALPPFREGSIDYKKLRVVLLRHLQYPIIISEDKKLYSMGHVTNFNLTDLNNHFNTHIRENSNWFQYSGIKSPGHENLGKLIVGEIKTRNGVAEKFVTTVGITSDLDTTLALNETDAEYYISGNPLYSDGWCVEGATFNPDTAGYMYNKKCTLADGRNYGARKVPGLQRLIGDGKTAVATDTDIFYIGKDGKGYRIDISENSENHRNILNGKDVVSELLTCPDPETHKHSKEAMEKGLWVIDIGYENMNHKVAPTYIFNDGSVYFAVRESDEQGNIKWVGKHMYLKRGSNDSIDYIDDKYEKMEMLLGPTLAYSQKGNMYHFTDVSAMGISYAPSNNQIDRDFLANINSDPVHLLYAMDNGKDKKDFFKLRYAKVDVNDALSNVGRPNLENFAVLPYNPLTDLSADFLAADGSATLYTMQLRPFRTNTYSFIDMSKGAEYNYIYAPTYFYGFDNSTRASKSTWINKSNGVMAGEVKHGNVSKVYGVFGDIGLGFRFTPYGRNTIWFANKKGVFTFVDFNVRKTKTSCPDGNNDTTAKCSTNGSSINDNDTKTFIKKVDTKLPDYFYVAKSSSDNILEESDGRNNYIATPFVTESRMANFPNTKSYKDNGFEPQLVSSYIGFQYKGTPGTTDSIQDQKAPIYIPQFWFGEMANRGMDNITQGQEANFFGDNGKRFYQYPYGLGMYRYYPLKSYPAWRSRPESQGTLQYQTRYGVFMPLSHGATANSIYGNMKELFLMGPDMDQTDQNNYISPRKYVTSIYAMYDKDVLAAGGDLGSSVFGNIEDNTDNATKNIKTNGIGYVMDKGNFMWRGKAPDLTYTAESESKTRFPKFVHYVK